MGSLVAISVLAFVTSVLGTWGASAYWDEWRRLRAWRGRILGAPEPVRFLPLLTPIVETALRTLERVGRAVPSGEPVDLAHLPNLYVAAGYRDPRVPYLFSGGRVVALCLLPTALLGLNALLSQALTGVSLLWSTVGLALVGWYGPGLWLCHQVDQRKQRILKAFPDALDLLVVSVEAGLALDSAVSRVAQEIHLAHAELGEELQRMALELRAGRGRQQAMRNLGLRTQVDEVQSFASMLIQTERFGTSLTQSLRVHSEGIRTQQQLKAEELAAKLPVKLLFPLIVFILPLVFLIVLGPVLLQGLRFLLPSAGQ